MPFKIIMFPFKILGNIFKSKKKRNFDNFENKFSNNLNNLKEKSKDENLNEKERKKIDKEIRKKEKAYKHLRRWKTNEFKSDRNPKNIKQFEKAKRQEKYFRRNMK